MACLLGFIFPYINGHHLLALNSTYSDSNKELIEVNVTITVGVEVAQQSLKI